MNRQEAVRRATELVEQMSVEELASQLRFDADEIPHLDIPEYNWWNEGLHGVARAGTATVFPQAIGLGATFDEELLERIGVAVSTEARAKYNENEKHEDRDIYKGITLWSPNVNLFRDPRWGRGHETYGEDPTLIAILGVAYIKGLQGEGEYLRTAACAKHFAVHSGPEEKRHYFDAKVSMKELWETYLPQFEACVREGKVEAVMGAYNRTNGEPCCAHSYLMVEVLRKQWGFQGHYVSDCWAIRDFHEHHKVTDRPEESVRLALEMGCDVNCGCTYQKILNAYEEGLISKELLQKSAIRLFTTRFLLGMFDETEYDQISYLEVESKEQLSIEAACKSVVLLKNDGILPLNKKKLKTIGVIGPNANSREALVGNYHGTASRYVTVLEGIQDYVGDDVRVLYSEGCHLFLDQVEKLAREDDRISEAMTVAEHSDLVILCLGLDESLEGEEGDTGNAYASGDKQGLMLPPSQQRLLETVAEMGVPFIVCMMAGSAMDLNLADNRANAVLQTWYPGARGGRAIADLLFGKESPSGKLPITFYKDLEGMPEFTDYSMKNRTYRYMEQEALYPFGYGLSYTEFSLSEPEITVYEGDKVSETGIIRKGTGMTVRTVIRNIGKMAGGETVQVYVKSCCDGTPNPQLKALKKVFLNPGEEQEVVLTLKPEAFELFDIDGAAQILSGEYCVYTGTSQPDKRSKTLTGKGGFVNTFAAEV